MFVAEKRRVMKKRTYFETQVGRSVLLAVLVTLAFHPPSLADERSDWLKAALRVKSAISTGVSYKGFGRLVADAQTEFEAFGLLVDEKKYRKQIRDGSNLIQILRDSHKFWSFRWNNCRDQLQFDRFAEVHCGVFYVDGLGTEDYNNWVQSAISIIRKNFPEAIKKEEFGGIIIITEDNKMKRPTIFLKLSLQLFFAEIVKSVNTVSAGLKKR